MLEEHFFRIERYQLSLAEMGILLRESVWMPYNYMGSKYGIIRDWIHPLFDYYSDLEILCFVMPIKHKSMEEIQQLEPDLITSLTEEIIRKHLYIYHPKEGR